METIFGANVMHKYE